MPLPTREEWASAFALQSQSDFRVYELLNASQGIPACHSLHYLQMACEKIGKAYRLRTVHVPVETILTSHVAFSKIIANLMTSADVVARYPNQAARLRQIASYAKALAREIEKLAPAVDRAVSPQNAEYPWQDNEKIVLPCQYDYPNLRHLKESRCREFLTLVRAIIFDFANIEL